MVTLYIFYRFLWKKCTVTWYRQHVQEHTVSGFRIFPAEQSKYSIFDFRNFGLFMGQNEGITSYCTFLYISVPYIITVSSTACKKIYSQYTRPIHRLKTRQQSKSVKNEK